MTNPFHTLAQPNAPQDPGICLTRCSALERVGFATNPDFVTDDRSCGIVRGMLKSWRSDVSHRSIFLRARAPMKFTRQEYASLLSTLGNIIEECIGKTEEQSSVDRKPETMKKSVVELHVLICDWGGWQEWWRKHLEGCFPSFAKRRWINIDYLARELPRLSSMRLDIILTGNGAH